MSDRSSISAIIVNYNGGGYLVGAIESLRAQTLTPLEIIVVDNASTDHSAAEAKRQFPEIELIELSENVGFAEGNNIGFRHSRGDYLALLNSDAIAHRTWSEALLKALGDEPRAASAVGKILVAGTSRLEQAGAEFNQLGNYWGRGYLQRDEGQFDDAEEVAGLTACATIVRRSALGDEPLFAPEIFMYGEELELTIRLRRRGFTIVYTPEAVAEHHGMRSVATRTENPTVFQQMYANRNRLRILFEYYPWHLILRSSPLLAFGVIYWNYYFLRHAGIRTAVRSAADQLKAVLAGIGKRRNGSQSDDNWLEWMTVHSLGDLRARHAEMERLRRDLQEECLTL